MNTNSQILNALDRGMQVDPQAKDRAISNLVMQTVSEHSTEEPQGGFQGVAGDEDGPSSAVRNCLGLPDVASTQELPAKLPSHDLPSLLESRHETLLQWCEPWPACGPEGNDLDAHIFLRATIHDCINMQRHEAKKAGRPTMGDDRNHLLDFMAIHFTKIVEANQLP